MAAAKTVLSQTMSINVEDGFDGEGASKKTRVLMSLLKLVRRWAA